MGAEALKAVREHELSAITSTYLGLGVFLLFILSLMLAVRMPDGRDDSAEKSDVASSFRRLFANSAYRNGVIAQFFYVGAQIGVWSFTIRLVMKELGVNESGASTYFLCSIACFTAARFLFTYLMRYYVPARLMSVAAVFAILGCVGVLMGNGMTAVVSLVSVSFFMSLMFPTIYGIALEGVKEDVKIGASGLIMAILGGAVLTPLQGYVSDVCGANVSYGVPLACFVVVLIYGINASKTKTNS
jgi:FHS family L-fucose permease-like MFS transporter